VPEGTNRPADTRADEQLQRAERRAREQLQRRRAKRRAGGRGFERDASFAFTFVLFGATAFAFVGLFFLSSLIFLYLLQQTIVDNVEPLEVGEIIFWFFASFSFKM
jgi:hypothetical protein